MTLEESAHCRGEAAMEKAFLSALHMTLRHQVRPGEAWDGLLAAVDVTRLPYTPL